MATERFRLRFTFWLDMGKPDELHLAEQIDELKQKRTFAKTIRDGIRLICDLRQGRLDVLFELFPWVKAEFIAGVQAQEKPSERLIRKQLERIEQQLQANGEKAILAPSLNTSFAQLPADLPSAFTTEEEPMVASQVRTNFSQSMGNLFTDDEDDLWS